MTQRVALSTRPLGEDNLTETLNREVLPFIRQLAPGTTITGSRGGATAAVLAQLLTVLAQAGIIKDATTP